MDRRTLVAFFSVALALLLGASASYAAKMGDCGHPVAARSIAACSRLIDRGGVTSKVLADHYLLRGTAYLSTTELDKAITDLDQAIRLEPANPEALVARGDAHRFGDNFERAIADYDEAIRIDPKYVFGYIAKLQAFGAMREHLRANELREEMERWGGPASNIENQAYFRSLARSRYDDTFAELDAAIAANPRDASAYFRRAGLFMFLGELTGGRQFTRAAADLDEAIRIDPTHAGALHTRAKLRISTKEPDRALEDLRPDRDECGERSVRPRQGVRIAVGTPRRAG